MSDEVNNKNPTSSWNIFDRAIAIFSPKRAYERLCWRSGINGYSAGNISRGSAGWVPTNAQGEMFNRQARRLMRARAQDLERNSDVTGAILDALLRNVVGKGFNLQALTKKDKFNEQAEALWLEWCKPRNCDITGQQSFREILKMVVSRAFIDGEILIIKTYTGSKKFPLQLQIREAADLDSLGLMSNPANDNIICDGIELDKYGKPVAYYLTETDALGMTKNTAKRIDASQVIYMWHRKRPSEYRGVTLLAKIIDRIHDLGEYIGAVSFMQKILASICVFIKQSLPDGARSIGRATADTKSPDGNQQTKIKPGQMKYLAPGEDVATLNPSGNSAEAAGFATMQTRMSAAAVGLSLEATARDVSQVNYSSARQNLLEDTKTYEDWQLWLKEHLLDEIYTEFLISAYLANQFPMAADFWENKETYFAHRFIGQGMSWIDPIKEVTANKIGLETGQTTLEDICAKAGKDWKDVLKQRAKEKAFMEQLGLSFAEGSKTNGNKGTDGNTPQAESD